MIGKKIDSDIKAVSSFLEFWGKFHSLYNEIISRERISKDDEAKFLESIELMKTEYDEMKKGLDLTYVPRARVTDPVSDILGLVNLHSMSEKNMKKADDDWRDSYVFLNNILERLKNNQRRMEQFNPIGVFLKRILESK